MQKENAIETIDTQRFLPAHGDRTVDQMVQAARSGKQNIIEGTEDGETSTEMHIKLLNVARGSIQELREDYYDYIKTRSLTVWTSSNERYTSMQDFCRSHNRSEDNEVPQLRQEIARFQQILEEHSTKY